MHNKDVGITYGFSSRVNGDMRLQKNRLEFLRQAGLPDRSLITPKQVHGNCILTVGVNTRDRSLEADALVAFAKTNIVLGIIVADCVPLLFWDKKGRAIGVAHAGWKGTYGNIAAQVVLKFKKNDIPSRDIYVFLGPHIGKCCYNVPVSRAKKFLLSSEKREGVWYVDLGKENIMQLIEAGIPVSHITDCAICTSSHNDMYYSYRKDSKETYGEILSFIGFS
jgi:polyphenol oxidase